jgi:hypothetical protein
VLASPFSLLKKEFAAWLTGWSIRWPAYVPNAERARPLATIDQIAIDALAEELYPGYPASTKNRQFYTLISAILKRAGIERKVRRPKAGPQ